MSIRSRLRLPIGRRRLAATIAGASALAITAAGVGVAVIISGSASASTDPRSFQAAPSGLTFNDWKPLALQNKNITVVVELAGDPVTVIEANSATPLTKSQRQTHRNELRAKQAPASQRIKSIGGKVLASYQLAYNGLKVNLPARQAPQLLTIPDVVAVHPVRLIKPDNVQGVPLIGAPAAWNGVDGVDGNGISIGIIDTGIDYTHADFGGPGTVEAFEAADATDTQPPDPVIFGPAAAKVKGGFDFVGDNYNASSDDPAEQIPQPDPNPLDCNGHGTHVSGTAAGFGVLADGTTYSGPYNADTIANNEWLIGPGVAPRADLYALRVFGCGGSADSSVIVDAIEWAVDHDLDVINMSLGSTWGDPSEPDSVASDNATKAGTIVVAAAGNDGFANPYLVGSPSVAATAISVAAVDPTPTFPGINASLSTGTTVPVTVSNDVTPAPGSTLDVVVLGSGGSVSLGCDPAEYVAENVTGKLVVTRRGTCARVARAVFGQQAGAAAVVMINDSFGYPPIEGHISGNPDTGEEFEVTIPFLGALTASTADWLAADGGTVTFSGPAQVPNPNFRGPATFTSGGPRMTDSWLKPDVAAPGVSIISAGVGTGNGPAGNSGTSMATPHTAGLAALVKQAHPSWNKVEYLKAAIVNTADPDLVTFYRTSVAGAGLVQAPAATETDVVALGDKGTSTLNFGFAELAKNYTKSKNIMVRNLGNQTVTFDVAAILAHGSPSTVSLSTDQITVPAHGSKTVKVTLTVPVATAGTSETFDEVAGLVEFTPRNGGNSGISLRVPYYLVPDAVSGIDTKLNTKALVKDGSATATITNKKGAVTGIADWYAWGLKDGKDKGAGTSDVRAVGVQTFPGPTPASSLLVFAVSMEKRSSSLADKEFDILIDVNRDGSDDYLVAGIDRGVVTTGFPTGDMLSVVLNLTTGGLSAFFFADARFDGSTILLPILFQQLIGPSGTPSLDLANPRINYTGFVGSITNGALFDEVDGVASFNVLSPSLSTGGFNVVAPGGSATETVTFDAAEFAQTPALGFLIISADNVASAEAQTIAVKP